MIRNSVRLQTSTCTSKTETDEDHLKEEVVQAVEQVCTLIKENKIPKSDDINFIGDSKLKSDVSVGCCESNCIYNFSAFFNGFAISFIDTVPSEVAVISLKKLDLMANWDKMRQSQGNAAISIEWLQIDNQCPSAPFPVAFSPVVFEDEDYEENKEEVPFLSIGVVFAPRHESKILVSIKVPA